MHAIHAVSPEPHRDSGVHTQATEVEMLQGVRRVALYVASLVLVSAIAAPSADAYIDPGSGSYIVQILIGAAAGAGLAIATFWRRIRAFFSRVFRRSSAR